MNARFETIQGPLSAKRLGVLRDIDAAVHDVILDALPSLSEYLGGEADLASLADLAVQIATEKPEAARAFADRLGSDPTLVEDYVGLRKWAVHALQKHRHDPKQMLHHFEWGNPRAFSDERSESDTEFLLGERGSLLHYLAGYGFDDFAIDLHEPEEDAAIPRLAAIEASVVRLPRRFNDADQVDRGLLLRAIFAHAAAHLRYSPLKRSAGNRRPTLVALTALIEDARVERMMVRDYPGLRALWGCFHKATKELSGFDFAGLSARLSREI